MTGNVDPLMDLDAFIEKFTPKPDVLAMWVVYDHPKDDRDHFIARRWVIQAGAANPTPTYLYSDDLNKIRDLLTQLSLTRLDRQPDDEKHIVEVWL